MRNLTQDILARVDNLKTYRRGDRRAPHKPLLLLIGISELLKGRRIISYENATSKLIPLLNIYAPPVTARHQPELPYWHLQSDGLWEIQGGRDLPLQKGRFPTMGPLKKTSAGFPSKFADAIVKEPGLATEIVSRVLDEHFPGSIHDDLLAQVGLLDIMATEVREPIAHRSRRRPRDPAFRESVLRAYEQRCAVTGFGAALGGSFFGCEAAHVMWHAYDGPDVIENGISMEPTLHKLFDMGAWTLTDDRRILVSREFTGTDAAIHRLRDHHGKPLREPVSGDPPVAVEFIRWHREPDLGGVFRHPPLAL
jgi:putative restriction endonuclease